MRIATPTVIRTVLLSALLLATGALALVSSSSATAPPPAPKPPLASTGYAPEVSTSGATIRGTVDPRGTETSFYVQYGPTPAYGLQTQPVAVGNGLLEVKVSQAISGLQSNTTYHYRVVASSSAGTTIGEDRAFTTKKIPLTFTILAAPRPDVFGTPLSISGTLSGSESVNHAVVLQENPFPYLSGFKDVAAAGTVMTDPAGNFSFKYWGLSQNTEFRVAALGATPTAPSVVSPGLIEMVAVRATFHVHSTTRPGFVQLNGSVAPASPGAVVIFQWLRSGHAPKSVGKAVVKRVNASVSRYKAIVRIRHGGLYRAFVQVPSGRQVSHYSRTARIR